MKKKVNEIKDDLKDKLDYLEKLECDDNLLDEYLDNIEKSSEYIELNSDPAEMSKNIISEIKRKAEKQELRKMQKIVSEEKSNNVKENDIWNVLARKLIKISKIAVIACFCAYLANAACNTDFKKQSTEASMMLGNIAELSETVKEGTSKINEFIVTPLSEQIESKKTK